MAKHPAWKKRERKGCRLFGAERKPVSGRQHDKDGDDGEHPRLHIQSKHSKAHAVVTVWDAAKRQALKSKKTPVVILSINKRPGQWLLIKDEDLSAVARELAVAPTFWPVNSSPGMATPVTTVVPAVIEAITNASGS